MTKTNSDPVRNLAIGALIGFRPCDDRFDWAVFKFGHSNLIFVSDFEIRVSYFFWKHHLGSATGSLG